MEKVIWSEAALYDMQQIHDFIYKDSPKYAAIMVNAFFDQADYLSIYTRIGRKVPEINDDSVREIIFKGYRLIYQIRSTHIEILSLIHGSKNLV
ncbi:MAG: type II toxin-antitoxin system RelE/ParE family toxin [Bacteroidia bacterium]